MAYRHSDYMKDKHNNPNQVNTTNMVSPLNSPDDLAEAESLTNEMFDDNIMMNFFFKTLLIRKHARPDILDMPRQVRRHH